MDSYQRGFGASIAATGDPTLRLRCSCCFMWAASRSPGGTTCASPSW